MPDKDFFRYGFRRGWWRPYRLACEGNARDVEVGGACIKALARSLRQAGGCPGFQDIAGVLGQTMGQMAAGQFPVSNGGPDISDAFRELDRISWEQGGNAVTQVAVRAAKSMLSKPEITPKDSLTRELAERICWGIAEFSYFAPAQAYLAGESGLSREEARSKGDRIKQSMAPAMASMASRLAKNPTAKGLRATPRKDAKRPTTSEMLGERLD